MVKKTDKDMTDQEMGMMYLKAAHSVRIYIYKWVLTDPSPNNFHLKNLWRVGQVAVHRGQTRASVLSKRLRNYQYPRNTDLPSQIAKTDAKGFKIFADTLEVIEVIEEPALPVVTARMTPIEKLPRVRAHARADEAEIRIIAELGVWRGFGAPEPWRQPPAAQRFRGGAGRRVGAHTVRGAERGAAENQRQGGVRMWEVLKPEVLP